MIDISKIDYSQFDRPEVLNLLFHPRQGGHYENDGSVENLLIPVDDDVSIGGCFHLVEMSAPNVLFFHGNGEIAADYNDIGRIYNQININFLAVDYRGYGQSTGSPSVTSMIRDSHPIFFWVKNRLEKQNCDGPLVLMGRSLGSASALELSSNYSESIDGLIIESGFSYLDPLLELLGINMKALGISEEKGTRNIDKIRKFNGPTLIIHGEYDHIIPFAEGRALYEASMAANKRLLKIANADHNTILFTSLDKYMEAVKELTIKASK